MKRRSNEGYTKYTLGLRLPQKGELRALLYLLSMAEIILLNFNLTFILANDRGALGYNGVDNAVSPITIPRMIELFVN